MKPIVCLPSCGRSGTNLCLEMLTGNTHLTPTEEEDRNFFRINSVHEDGTLTKCDVVYYNKDELISTMDTNPNLKLIWTFRDPRDMILSKIVRGQPTGGDHRSGRTVLADDATLDTAIQDITDMFNKRKCAMDYDSSRNYTVRMEDLILNQIGTLKEICSFLDVPYEEGMVDFVPRMRNEFKRNRYKTLDKSQVSLWKNGDDVYDGFFKNYEMSLSYIIDRCEELVGYMGYESNNSIV
tara:strand:- start:229 stop:942 length:714 start_codon:yes stop_codon:yes gene_type:complete